MPLPPKWSESGFEKTVFGRAAILGVSLAFLFLIWHRNYNLIGELYDYSIMSSAAGHLQAGRLPYRDFTTPLQSLTIYLGYAAEKIFGPRYLSLAYANLVIGVGYYFLLLRLLKPVLPFPLRVLTATALVTCTFFQHGIIWYNALAMMFLCLACFQAIAIFRAEKIKTLAVAQLCLWLFLSSMTKFNFHTLALGLVSLIFAARLWLRPADFKPTLLAAAALVVCGIILGPATEVLVNRTTLANFVQNVFVIPSGRAGYLGYLFSSDLYVYRLHDSYPDDMSLGVYAVALLVYLLCLLRLQRTDQAKTSAAPGREAAFTRYCALAALPIFFISSQLLTVTNYETQILTSSFLLAGLVCVFLLLERGLTEPRKNVLHFFILLLAVYFAIIGGGSAFMHSRVRYRDYDLSRAFIYELKHHRTLLEALTDLPLFDVQSISPRFAPYLEGVQMTETGRSQLASVASFMDQTHPDGLKMNNWSYRKVALRSTHHTQFGVRPAC